MICSFVKDERFGSNRIGNLVEFYMNDRIIEIFKIFIRKFEKLYECITLYKILLNCISLSFFFFLEIEYIMFIFSKNDI